MQEESEAEQRKMALRLNLDHTVPASATVSQEPSSVAQAALKKKQLMTMSEREPRLEVMKNQRARKFTIKEEGHVTPLSYEMASMDDEE